MGFFSSVTTVDVSSVLYNLAGGPDARVRYLPTTVTTKIISNSQFSLSDVMREALLKGPGMRMRSFARWARTSGYNQAIGLQPSGLQVGNNIDLTVLANSIPHAVGETVSIQGSDIGSGDFTWWADQWLANNHPDLVFKEYVSDFNSVTNVITITVNTPTPQVFSFQPVGLNLSSRYLYFGYTITSGSVPGPLVPGSTVSVGSPAGYPSTSGWTDGATVTTPISATLVKDTKVVKSYSDGRPNETTNSSSTSTGTFNNTDKLFSKSEFKGRQVDGSLLTENSYMHQIVTGVVVKDTPTVTTTTEVISGVTVTTTTTITPDIYSPRYAYRIDKQNVTSSALSNLKIVIYPYNTGNASYDAMFSPEVNGGNFFPPIPIRVDNNFISASFRPDLYAFNKKAYKKAVNSSYDKIVKTVADNASIGDIDYAYVAFGVPLNTTENASKKYIYRFLQSLISSAGSGETEYNTWKAAWEAADASQRNWLLWNNAQSVPTDPLYGKPEPVRIPYPVSSDKRITLRADPINYNMRFSWLRMNEITGTGQAWPGAKQGQLKFETGIPEVYEELVAAGAGTDSRTLTKDFITFIWQDEVNSWRAISSIGLVHFNTIYKGIATYIQPSDAFADPDESGFIVPLQEDIFRQMSLKDASQMGMASAYMVFNCYTKSKRRWYQSGLFNVILVIVIIIVSVMTGGAGASTAGVLGTAASVGATLGFTGLVAIIVGAVANAIAAIIIAQIISLGANALFGDQFGQIIGTIASVIAINIGTSMASGQGFAASFSKLSSAENLLKLSVAAGKGYNDFVNTQTGDMLSATQDLVNSFEESSKKLEELYKTNLGVGINRTFNPMDFLQASRVEPFIPESSSAFLSRTLLTGSDIANMTNNMLSNFAQITISNQLPT
ncbi:MAG: hypothetical protein [Caudoviricetes sp.]|nr:MAG: hypothetical protein [Caudoviricetes sp.]